MCQIVSNSNLEMQIQKALTDKYKQSFMRKKTGDVL